MFGNNNTNKFVIVWLQPWKTSPSYAIVPMQHTYINTSYPTYNNTYAAHPPNAGPSYCNAIVPVSDKWVRIYSALSCFISELLSFVLINWYKY